MSNHIHYMHNKTDGKLTIEKKDSSGRYTSVTDVPAGNSGGPFDDYNLSDLKFIFDCSHPVYFKFVRNKKDKDDITHIDGETGHPEGS